MTLPPIARPRVHSQKHFPPIFERSGKADPCLELICYVSRAKLVTQGREGEVMSVAKNQLLIIEDDLATLFAMRTLFERRGWGVTVARSIEGAMEALTVPPPDWIILDLFLLDGDGEDFLRRVRLAKIESRIAIVSGLLDPERVVRLLQWKPDLLMAKPVDFSRLASECLEQESALASPISPDFDPIGYLEAIQARSIEAV